MAAGSPCTPRRSSRSLVETRHPGIGAVAALVAACSPTARLPEHGRPGRRG
ncbi:hypothetical protein PSTAB_0218 [Stutzerimonas stutzeri]|uniref:Uncharacterized protein n=1 Tax=Stutzerimonas stutzeri (strain ATCC 17588 / DSM 5190 / CCUG 11256 / JCM 5965 / LMG 11199 / NBRC 14165 / NCIMB 11358 / Stanier 221) TaxID=96563 RepID=F8H562_STUS2|nr:hypothetical protein PSTAB_0218 [Stutzerimonas stutzeri]